MPITAVDESTASGPADLPKLDRNAFPESEVIATVSEGERKQSPFEQLQRKILGDLEIQATQGSLMLCSDLLNSVAQLEFVDKDVLDDQAARLVEIRERENPTARQLWGPTAIRIAKKGLELRLSGEADLLVPKAVAA